MTTVYKRSNSPFWYYDLVDPVTKARRRVSTKRTLKREAEQVAAVALRKRQDQAQLGASEEWTLRQTLEDYIEAQKAKRRTDVANQTHLAEKTLGKLPGKYHLSPEMPLHDLTTKHVEVLAVKRLAEGYSPVTVNHEVGLLRSAWRAAKRLGARTMPEVDFKLQKVTPKTRYLSGEEFQRVYEALSPDAPIKGRSGKVFVPSKGRIREERQEAQDMLVALALTGGRWGEIAKLTWDMVDLIDYTTINLYGWKDRQERAVPVSDMVREMFRRRRARMPGTIYVFPGRGGDAPRSGPSRAIGRAMDRVGLNAPHLVARFGRATIHSLRHTFASWTLQGGATLAEVQSMLGHAGPAMTQRYAHLEKSAVVEKAASILNKMVGQSGECAASVPSEGTAREGVI